MLRKIVGTPPACGGCRARIRARQYCTRSKSRSGAQENANSFKAVFPSPDNFKYRDRWYVLNVSAGAAAE